MTRGLAADQTCPAAAPQPRPTRRAVAVRLAGWTCYVALAGVFLWAALPKVRSPQQFALLVYRYQLLPLWLVNPAAVMMPWVELVCATSLLVVPRLRDAAAGLLFAMLGVFAVAMGITMARGIEVACGCFSTDPSKPIGPLNILRNAGLMVVAAVAFWTARRGRPAISRPA